MTAGEKSTGATYRRLLTDYVRPHRAKLRLAILCLILSSLAEPALPWLLKMLVDDGFRSQAGSWDWLVFPVALAAIFIIRAIVGYAADLLLGRVSQNVILEMRRHMFARLVGLPTTYFEEQSSGRLLSRIAYDVNGVAQAASQALTTLVRDTASIVALLALLFYLNWKLTLITLAMIPFIAMAVRYFSRRVRTFARGIQESQGNLTQLLQEAIEGHKIVKIYNGQAYEKDRFERGADEQKRLQLRAIASNAALGPIVQFFTMIAISIIIGFVLYQAAQGQATVGDLISFITATTMTLAPLKRLTGVNAAIQAGVVAAESVFELIDQHPEVDTGTTDLGRAKGHIQFDAVSFSYPATERPAVDAVSFDLRPGESVALVGASGSGKTTIASLLPRFQSHQSGEIRIDGTRLQDIRLTSLRENIALVSQEVVLFNDTLAANIAYGRTETASMEAIRAAARAAHAEEFIERLPERYDTLVGERGIKLSGGQRQRIAIARAILKKAPILILDEATSALDTESERHVQAALEALMQDCTTLVIAHRLSTIENATRIVVLDQGRIVETGAHSELLARGGVYARLHQRQFVAGE